MIPSLYNSLLIRTVHHNCVRKRRECSRLIEFRRGVSADDTEHFKRILCPCGLLWLRPRKNFRGDGKAFEVR